MKLKKGDFDRRILTQSAEVSLSAEEGFLCSRVAGGLSLKELLSLCPWPEAEALKLIEGLFEKEVLAWQDAQRVTRVESKSEAQEEDPKTFILEEALVSQTSQELPKEVEEQLQMDNFEVSTRDIELSFRKDILLRLHLAPEQNPYEILGVKRTATQNEIKMKYLDLSRKFHPDRFFRRKLGAYKRRLEKLFSFIQGAYQDLKNPHDREALDRKLKMKDAPSKSSTPKTPRRLDPSLEKIGKAEHYYRLGLEARKKGDLMSAYNSVNLAVQLNPEKILYSQFLKELEPLIQVGRAKDYVQKAQEFMDIGLLNDALQAAELGVNADPESGEAALIAGKMIIELGLKERMDEAVHLLRRAKTKLTIDPEPCILLGRIFQARRDKKAARHEYEMAMKRDPQNELAKKLLSKL